MNFIFETFHPLYQMLKLFGIIGYEIKSKSVVGKAGWQWKSVLWSIFWFKFTAYLIYSMILRGAIEPGEKSTIVLSGWHWLLIFQLLSTYFIQLWSYSCRKNVRKYFYLLNEFDSFDAFNSPHINYNLIKNHTQKLLIVALGILVSIIALAFFVMNICHNESYDVISNIAYFYATWIYILTNYQFIFTAFNIKLRFDLLNKTLKLEFFTKSTNISCVESSRSFTHSIQMELVRKIALMHDKLNDAVDMINSSFACELLPGMVYVLFTTMLSCFTIFRTLYNPVIEEISSATLNFVWTWFIVIFMIATIKMATSTSKKGNNCCVMISRSIINSFDETFLDQLAVVSQQIRHRTTTFSCGFFPIDWTLAFSMISACCTYLFIILQFEMSRTLNGSSNK